MRALQQLIWLFVFYCPLNCISKKICKTTFILFDWYAQVLRQFAIQDILGEELGSAISGNKSIDDALKTAQYRINDLLENI